MEIVSPWLFWKKRGERVYRVLANVEGLVSDSWGKTTRNLQVKKQVEAPEERGTRNTPDPRCGSGRRFG